jgi:DNA-binding transcriptional regulator PaaX
LERDQKATGDRIYRLTEQGRLHALGGRDPAAQWSRHWDGRWRLVLFDVPMEQHIHRGRLRRYLHAKGFGCLQGSVWITPDPVHGEREILAGGKSTWNPFFYWRLARVRERVMWRLLQARGILGTLTITMPGI